MGSKTGQDGPPGGRVEEGQHVADADDDVEALGDAGARQVELGQIGDEPGQAGVIMLGGIDQHRVDVHADDLVTGVGQLGSDATRAAPGVEHSRGTRRHGIDADRRVGAGQAQIRENRAGPAVGLDDPLADGAQIADLVGKGYLVRTRADANNVEPAADDTTRLDAALASGAQWVSTDYPGPDGAKALGSSYVAELPGFRAARCNPVTAPASCDDATVEP